jgi:hypothetical protein
MTSRLVRIVLVLAGIVLLGAGWLAWMTEDEFGSGTDFSIKSIGTRGDVIVYETNEQTGTRTEVFEGSPEDAREYMKKRRAEGRSFVTPGLLLALGGVLLVAGVLYRRKTAVPSSA